MRLAAAAALLASAALPLRAQVEAALPASAVPAQAAPAAPKPSCPCDVYGFTPLTEKAKAAQEYWKARSKAKVARDVSSIFFLFGAMAHDGAAVNEAQDSYGRAMNELYRARAKAEGEGAVKVVGDDLSEASITFLLKKGVDYVVKP